MTRIDPAVLGGTAVLDMLNTAGFLAYVVGGPVRNALLGAPVADIDIATNAHPVTVMTLAREAGLKAVPTGIDHGTVTLIDHGTPIEVTTFRRDVATDGRRAVVAFAETIEQDARRRDFTMNALYADRGGAVLDPLGGMEDLMARRVRFIDDPEQRIREDYLRILRFFRFFAWYGDQRAGLDADGLAACAALSDGIALLSRERLGAEMIKLLSAADPCQAVAAMAQSGVLSQVLPGASAAALPILVHLEDRLAPDPLRRLAVLGGPDCARALRLSSAQSKYLTALRNGIDGLMPALEAGYRLGAQTGRDLVLVRAALFEQPLDQADLADVLKGAEARFALKAKDVPHLTGPDLGRALQKAERAWLESRFTLTLPDLIAMTRT